MNDLDSFQMRKGRHRNGSPDILAWLIDHCPAVQYLSISDLVKAIHSELHYSPERISAAILEFYRSHKELVSLERTSEIFITGNTRGGRVEKRRLRFFPLLNDSYVSHMILRKPVGEFIGQKPPSCYNCEKRLILDFIPMLVDKRDENRQFLFEDVEPLRAGEMENFREFDFEICAKCGAAQ